MRIEPSFFLLFYNILIMNEISTFDHTIYIHNQDTELTNRTNNKNNISRRHNVFPSFYIV